MQSKNPHLKLLMLEHPGFCLVVLPYLLTAAASAGAGGACGGLFFVSFECAEG